MSGPNRDWLVYRRLLAYSRPKFWAFGLTIFGFLLYASTSAMQAELVRQLIIALDKLGARSPTISISDPIVWLPLGIVGIFVIRGVGTFLSTYYMEMVSRFVIHQLRMDLFSKLLNLPTAYFDKNSSGHLVNRINFNVEQVASASSSVVTSSLREGLTVLVTLGYMFYLEWQLTLVLLGITPVVAIVVTKASRYFRKYSKRIQNSMGEVTQVASENIQGQQVVKIYDGQQRELDRFEKVSQYNYLQSLKLQLAKAVSTPIIQFFLSLELAAIIWLSFVFEVPAHNLIAFFTAAIAISKPMRALTQISQHLQKGLAAATDIFIQLDEQNELSAGHSIEGKVKGAIEFQNLCFQYETSNDLVLNQISLNIDAGSTLALVGRSGSGKSTLVHLIPRFYEPVSGEIRLDGQLLSEIELASLRKQIAIVSQSPQLFQGSIAENIGYAAPEAQPEQIREAARKAHVLEFSEQMPDGLETQIGANGVLLSGGQRQRIAIARAILKDAPILILDEATSALDSESEKLIQDALDQVMKNRTTIVIAHRLSTIENADKIAVMDNGKVIEHGSHQELIAKGGLYAQLHQIQFRDSYESD
jgi:subfamily B ATP-binding cassette protein MsbA